MKFNGLIQHSFALRLAKEHRPFEGPSNLRRVQERFSLPAGNGAAFEARPVCGQASSGGGDTGRSAKHSPLVECGRTTVQPLPIRPVVPLPFAFQWAANGKGDLNPRRNEPRLIFAERHPATGEVDYNDFLIERPGCDSQAQSISRTLLRVVAHKRSRLLGLALAGRVVSVMLPHAVLTPVDGSKGAGATADRSWFVQPLLSFIHDGRVKSEFRDSYSLTLLLLPVQGKEYRERKMTVDEIDRTVNVGWGLAAVPTDAMLPQFQADGPLPDYLARLTAPCDPTNLLRPSGPDSEAGGCWESLTLRRATEVLAFSVGLKLAQGRPAERPSGPSATSATTLLPRSEVRGCRRFWS